MSARVSHFVQNMLCCTDCVSFQHGHKEYQRQQSLLKPTWNHFTREICRLRGQCARTRLHFGLSMARLTWMQRQYWTKDEVTTFTPFGNISLPPENYSCHQMIAEFHNRSITPVYFAINSSEIFLIVGNSLNFAIQTETSIGWNHYMLMNKWIINNDWRNC